MRVGETTTPRDGPEPKRGGQTMRYRSTVYLRRWPAFVLIAGAFAACGLETGGIGQNAGAEPDADVVKPSGLPDGTLLGDTSKPPPDGSGTTDGEPNEVGPTDDGGPTDEGGPDVVIPDAGPDVRDAKVDVEAGPTVLTIQINVNGPALTGTQANDQGTWRADPGADGGVCGTQIFSGNAPASRTVYVADPTLYSGEMFGDPLTCRIKQANDAGLPVGKYDVTLYMAEIYYGVGCPGGAPGANQRVFDIVLEGTTVQTDLDLYLQGQCIATQPATGSPVILVFPDIQINDGQLDISMPASKDKGTLTGIRIVGPH